MKKYHIVEQGECLSSIAASYGFSSHRKIYEHSDNSELRKKRPNPNVLLPGDKIAIPDCELKEISLNTEQHHKIVVSRPKVSIRLYLLDRSNKPLKHVGYEIRFNNEVIQGTTSTDGLVEEEIPVSLREASLEVPRLGIRRLLRFKYLDPSDSPTGIRSRLNSLGFEVSSTGNEDDPTFKAAVSAFQKSEGLKDFTGVVDSETRRALEKRFGS